MSVVPDSARHLMRGLRPALWLRMAFGMVCLMAAAIPAARAAGTNLPAVPVTCHSLQTQYPSLRGKTLVDAINPHTPGYEALDPEDPSQYVGFDIDLVKELGACLGFNVTYKSVGFAALLPRCRAARPIS